MTTLWLDFETRSRCDLKAHGVYNYALDPSTEVLCLCYAFDDGEVQTWVPSRTTPDDTIPMEVLHHKGQIRAHNAAFERLIFQHVLCFNYHPEQFYCTATQSRANCAPGGLGDVPRFAGTSMKKDYRGAQLIRWLSLPRADGTFMEDAKLMQEMQEYCAQDVRVMREISKSMRELTDEELYDYHVNERINDRGVLVDVPLCEAAVKYAAEETKEIEQLVQEISGGVLTSVRSPRMRDWVYDRVGPDVKKMMESYTDGEKKISIDKTVRTNLLRIIEDEENFELFVQIPPEVADVIQCADDLWASSVAKFKRLADLADLDDDRVRGAFVFAGGSATGRAASYGAQVHNFGRKCAADPEAVRTVMVRGHKLVPEHGKTVNEVLKGMLRPAIMPSKGKVFVVADWSAIEGRVNPWLVNSADGEAKLQQYRDGLDPYKVNAAALYKVKYDDVTKDQRQTGKIQELALGFLGGAGSLAAFSKAYNTAMSEAEINYAVQSWRGVNPWAMQHGKALEGAYTRAMRNPGHEVKACRVTYLFDGTHLWYSLPSGRILCYPFAKLDPSGVSYAKASWKPAATAKEWPRGNLWYGLAVENCTQAAANDILRYALRELDDLYYDIVLHVHDEIVIETSDPDQCIKDMTRIMTTPPAWATGLPLGIEIETMTRYKK